MAGSSFRPRMDYLAEDEASDEIVTEFRNSSSSSSNEEEEISRIALGEEDEEVRTLAIFRLNKYSLRKFCNSNIMQFEKKGIRKLCNSKVMLFENVILFANWPLDDSEISQTRHFAKHISLETPCCIG